MSIASDNEPTCRAIGHRWHENGDRDTFVCTLPDRHDGAHEERDGRGKLLYRWGEWMVTT